MGQLDGRIALVTGAASGIGARCATTLAGEGATVVVTDLDPVGGAAVVRDIEAAGGMAEFLPQDVTDESRWSEVIAHIEATHGRLDILVANAGIAVPAASITQMSLADWRKQTAVNIDGVFLTIRHGLPLMRQGGRGGSIVVMSSIAGLRGAPSLAGYSATKGAVRLLSKSVALECTAAGDGIRVNSVHPGIIDTPIWNAIRPEAAGHNGPSVGQEMGRNTPIGHAADPQEIANGVLFLASDASRYMTGSELVIDGGVTAGSNRRAPG
ncbi:dehydrogenase [Oceanicola sp. 22II-s10i]|uniref:SDR family NAD(P)-dependent oxidoreductase n=1 Tax=Oceanicola sp. 22II-s10i TaxID=1317116 RepID=UPI000B52689B|nr:SDR family oxidoreductase [Oceanicola sp. 22II-s10i]OWU83437.1 dehydrogenase [Oceanicola sp. 22II-s10i]